MFVFWKVILSEFSKFNFMDNKTSPLVLKAWNTHEPPINWSITFRKEKKTGNFFKEDIGKPIYFISFRFQHFSTFFFGSHVRSIRVKKDENYFIFCLVCFVLDFWEQKINDVELSSFVSNAEKTNQPEIIKNPKT